MATKDIIPILQNILTLENPQTTPELIQPSTYINFSDVDSNVFGNVNNQPLTTSNIQSVEGLNSTILQVATGFGNNIGDIRRFMASPSGFWKVSLIIAGKSYGKTESYIVGGGLSYQQASAASTQLAQQRAKLFGSNGTSPPTSISDANPGIQYIRVQDAYNPRNVTVRDFSAAPFQGNGYATTNGADFFSIGISNRQYGLNQSDGVTLAKRTVSIIGMPDACVVGGAYVGNQVLIAAATSWDSQFANFLAYLGAPQNKLGFLGKSVAEPVRTVSGSSRNATTGIVTLTCTNNYSNGDRVRISGCKPSGLNGTYTITNVSGTTFDLVGTISPLTALPQIAKSYRVQLANGTKVLDFYTMVATQANPQVRKRDVGKVFTPISFRKRRKAK